MSDPIFPLFTKHLQGHLDAVNQLEALAPVLQQAADHWIKALRSGHKIIFFGNGGSAADAQHFAAELVVRYKTNRPAMAGIALTVDSSILTAHSNDFGYESVYARQIEALAQAGDVAVGISTSGKSESIRLGLEAANNRGCTTICLTGANKSPCSALAEISIHAPSSVTAHIQECHLIVGHLLCGYVECQLANE
jgi:D-sedoheptulose 7-phosphate isomerase